MAAFHFRLQLPLCFQRLPSRCSQSPRHHRSDRLISPRRDLLFLLERPSSHSLHVLLRARNLHLDHETWRPVIGVEGEQEGLGSRGREWGEVE